MRIKADSTYTSRDFRGGLQDFVYCVLDETHGEGELENQRQRVDMLQEMFGRLLEELVEAGALTLDNAGNVLGRAIEYDTD